MNRLVLPATSARASERIVDLHDTLESFAALEPVPLAEVADGRDFATAVSTLTGAVVLLDALATRGGVAAGTHVWHSDEYEGSLDAGGLFEELHIKGAQSCAFEGQFREKESTRADDYDGRILTLRGAALVRDPRRGGVYFLLDTAETCYAATEYASTRCKHLPDAAHPGTAFRLHEALMLWERDSASTALPMLTTSAAVLLDPAGDSDERALLVMRRSGRVRHGAGGLAVPGGVMNLGAGPVRGDEDDTGSPRPAAAVARELLEETGLDVAPENWTPLGLVVVNERTRGSATRSGATGQLVATLLYMATLETSIDSVRRARDRLATHAGRYESDSLDVIPMPRPQSQDAAAFEACADSVVITLDRLSTELDQRTLVAALYVAERLYGTPSMMAAFQTTTSTIPWWARPWNGELDSAGPRRLVDPAELLLRGVQGSDPAASEAG